MISTKINCVSKIKPNRCVQNLVPDKTQNLNNDVDWIVLRKSNYLKKNASYCKFENI